LYHNIRTFTATSFFAVCLKKRWYQLPEDDEILATKHVGAMQMTVSVNYKSVQLLSLRKYFSLRHNARNKNEKYICLNL